MGGGLQVDPHFLGLHFDCRFENMEVKLTQTFLRTTRQVLLRPGGKNLVAGRVNFQSKKNHPGPLFSLNSLRSDLSGSF